MIMGITTIQYHGCIMVYNMGHTTIQGIYLQVISRAGKCPMSTSGVSFVGKTLVTKWWIFQQAIVDYRRVMISAIMVNESGDNPEKELLG